MWIIWTTWPDDWQAQLLHLGSLGIQGLHQARFPSMGLQCWFNRWVCRYGCALLSYSVLCKTVAFSQSLAPSVSVFISSIGLCFEYKSSHCSCSYYFPSGRSQIWDLKGAMIWIVHLGKRFIRILVSANEGQHGSSEDNSGPQAMDRQDDRDLCGHFRFTRQIWNPSL